MAILPDIPDLSRFAVRDRSRLVYTTERVPAKRTTADDGAKKAGRRPGGGQVAGRVTSRRHKTGIAGS
jgi:hypothetical protein